jgi:acetolactate synthase-1/2/3 large subunit
VLDECDLLIAVGARFDDRATGKVAAFCPQARIIHIDIDPAELDKIKTAHIGITADVQEALTACCRPFLPTNAATGGSASIRLKAEFLRHAGCRPTDRTSG